MEKISKLLMRIIQFDKNARATWTSLFSICVLRKEISMEILVTEKHQNKCFIQVKHPFSVVEVSKPVNFWKKRMLVLTSY